MFRNYELVNRHAAPNYLSACQMNCVGNAQAYCVPQYANGLGSCQQSAYGLTCKGPCEGMQRNCFGRKMPVQPERRKQLAVFPSGINNTHFNGDPVPQPLGFLALNQRRPTRCDAYAGETGANAPIAEVYLSPEPCGAAADGALNLVNYQPGIEMRFGDPVVFTFGGRPATEYKGRTPSPDVCIDRSTVGGQQHYLNEGCLLSRAWTISSADNLVPRGSLVRYQDLFVLEDALNLAGSRRFLRYVGEGGACGQHWVLTEREYASTFMMLDVESYGCRNSVQQIYNTGCTFNPLPNQSPVLFPQLNEPALMRSRLPPPTNSLIVEPMFYPARQFSIYPFPSSSPEALRTAGQALTHSAGEQQEQPRTPRSISPRSRFPQPITPVQF